MSITPIIASERSSTASASTSPRVAGSLAPAYRHRVPVSVKLGGWGTSRRAAANTAPLQPSGYARSIVVK
jgi:hypothetical protein